MKKLIIALLASVLMAAGFVGATGTAANAEQCDRYGVCIKPKPEIVKDKNVDQGERPKVNIVWGTQGDAVVKGKTRMIIKAVGGPVVSNKVKKIDKNGAVTIQGPKGLAPGRYKVTVKLIPNKNTPWKRVTRTYWITVS
ncbi:hypothetical protein GGQ22_12235 [Nocardioides sp. zg-579]|uniref:Uncharacterized protein n=1 Tax=Nocardioides marmotae TaxID=2663857 RepID=A0A6I3JCP5_9ACTN|nr:hypothetical protein [Nocardioides marmotae]MCR6032202.1 hypothetical protein [Gordonia jinghuaiqii]MTB95849.1 hypothetical protein [Nocardioides marmotae]QKE02800.1 hypothetical protein HPC71_18300 [Nocardioides marmotae]